MSIKHIHLQCSCHAPEHVVRVTLETWAGEKPEVTVTPMLNDRVSFLRRLIIAIRYVFRARDSNWDFDCVIVDDESMRQLTTLVAHRNLVVKLQEMKRRREKKALKDANI